MRRIPQSNPVVPSVRPFNLILRRAARYSRSCPVCNRLAFVDKTGNGQVLAFHLDGQNPCSGNGTAANPAAF